MDETDWQIMDALLRDARTPFSEIGNRLGLRKDNIQRRVKSLHEKGILGTPTIILDSKKCGFEGIVDFFIKLVPGSEDISKVEAKLAEMPYVIWTAKAMGAYNLYISSFFRDFDNYREIIETVKRTEQILSFEMVVYSKDISNPILIPFVDNRPEDSIVYKTRTSRMPR